MDDPGFNDVYHVGVIGKILRVFEMPGGNTTVIMQSNGPKVHLDSITKNVSIFERDGDSYSGGK